VASVEVFDPDVGETIWLTLLKDRSGREFLRRIPRHNYDPDAATPRLLESQAAFAEAAASAYGQKMTGDLPPATEPVRTHVPEVMEQIPRSPSEAEELQAYYRSLLTSDEWDTLRDLDRSGVRARVRRKPKPPPPVPLTRRTLPPLEELPPPPY
jgi:hypothetical protein